MFKYLQSWEETGSWVATSGGFDPMHIGHLRCIQNSVKLAKEKGFQTVVIVNGDGFLKRKKGKAFMPEQERAEIIKGIAGVDKVVLWDDGSQTVTGALAIIQPKVFTKGGDRTSSQNVPEFDLCEKIGCEVVFNVGGGKIQSSSELISASDKKQWSGKYIEKPWGFEVIWGHTEDYVGKILHINPGQALSLQYHEVKEETVLVLEGVLTVSGDSNIKLFPGEKFHVVPNHVHRFSCEGTVPTVLVEVSTNNLTDVVRLKDNYGRD